MMQLLIISTAGSERIIDMARMYPLFSSSKGNCTYLGDKNSGILIDAGVSCKQICLSLEDRDIPLDAVKAIFITHIHSDHISGLRVLSKKLGVPVYAQEKNLEILADRGFIAPGAELIAIDGGTAVAGDFAVSHFVTSHDVPASCGYRVEYPDGKTAALCTDLGFVSDEVRAAVTGVDALLIESNYDPDMLEFGPYPRELKNRIASRVGHLSNKDCAAELMGLVEGGTCRLILGHLSQENNTSQTAESCAVAALGDLRRGIDYQLIVARPSQNEEALIF